jgi:hypothetical protein
MHPVIFLSFSLYPPLQNGYEQPNNSNNIRAPKWQVVTLYEYLRTSIYTKQEPF